MTDIYMAMFGIVLSFLVRMFCKDKEQFKKALEAEDK